MTLLLIVVCSLLCIVWGKPHSGLVVKEDLPHVACDVCERTVEEIWKAVDIARSTKPKGKLDELEIIEIIEGISNPGTEAGEWMRRIDIFQTTVKDKEFLSLIEPGGTAKCLNECSTIAKSCQDLLGEQVDIDELASVLWKNKTPVADLKKIVCSQWTSRCRPRRKALSSSYKRVDEEFIAMSEKDIEMDRMMESMRAMGMGGSLYSRDDLGDMMGMDDEGEDEDFAGMDPYQDMPAEGDGDYEL
mmetsp:Transcript_73995/g.145227  ORF Transcript_73995/g.145227 Transcript_73995/m.145227 type:complete len:245 (+) Transcript_73995:29-763(+)